jgi:hypothetical protein
MKTSDIKKGMSVWIPCEVRGGPFPNERRVYIKTALSEWFGFVNTSELKKQVLEGDDEVRATVLANAPDHVVVGIRGQSPASGAIMAPPSLITNATLQT